MPAAVARPGAAVGEREGPGGLATLGRRAAGARGDRSIFRRLKCLLHVFQLKSQHPLLCNPALPRCDSAGTRSAAVFPEEAQLATFGLHLVFALGVQKLWGRVHLSVSPGSVRGGVELELLLLRRICTEFQDADPCQLASPLYSLKETREQDLPASVVFLRFRGEKKIEKISKSFMAQQKSLDRFSSLPDSVSIIFHLGDLVFHC